MGWREDEATAYDNELRRAERHFNGTEPRCGGRCRECEHCVRDAFDEVDDQDVRDELTARYGICIKSEEHPFLVPLDQWHDWEECWMEAVS